MRSLCHRIRSVHLEPFARTQTSIPDARHTPRMVYENPVMNVFGGLEILGGVRPPVDVREEDDMFIVGADLPGVKKDNIELRIGPLEIMGEHYN